MLSEGKIQLDRMQIESMYQKHVERIKKLEQKEDVPQIDKNLSYELVTGDIFARQFIPLCVDSYSKQTSLKLYPLQIGNYDFELIGERLRLFYEAVNSFKQLKEKHQLATIFKLDQISNLISHINQHSQSKDQNQFIPYIQQAQTLQKVEIWRFKHTQQSSSIPYKQRINICKAYQLILRLLEKLLRINQFQHLIIGTSNILLLHYPKCDPITPQYQLRLQTKWVFDLLFQTKSIKVKDFDVIDNARKILRKILGITEDKTARSSLDNYHCQKIQYLLNLQDIIKLNYKDYYFSKQAENAQDISSEIQRKQQLEQIKQQILFFEELAKKQSKNLKLQNLHPKLTQTIKQNNKLLWVNIQKYILSNVTESQRSNILNPVEKKPVETAVKKPQRKPSATNVKKQTKPEPKQVSKIQQKPQSADKDVKSQRKQLIVEANFIASASDIKFRPEQLHQLIENKQSVLYIMKAKNKSSFQFTHIICFINAKPQKQTFSLFGAYSPDLSCKSFIYSQKTEKFYKLSDKSQAVGYGPEVFLSVGKLDIIVPCFGVQIMNEKQMLKCVSYFPVSYSAKGTEMNGLEKIEDEEEDQVKNERSDNELGLEKEFFLEDIDIYEIRLKGQ